MLIFVKCGDFVTYFDSDSERWNSESSPLIRLHVYYDVNGAKIGAKFVQRAVYSAS